MTIALALSAAVIPFLLIFAPHPSVAAGPSGNLQWPVPGSIIRVFSKPTGPYGEGGHQGVDLAAVRGTQVRAPGDGTVAWVGEVPRGRFVSLSHAGGVRTTCLDLDGVYVRRGERVSAGQVIGTVLGSRDDSSSASHLHFDAFVGGVPVDPQLLMSGDGLDESSFIRLCPVEDVARTARAPGGAPETRNGTWKMVLDSAKGLFSGAASMFKGVYRGFITGCSTVGVALTRAERYVERGIVKAWRGGIFPALKKAGTTLWSALKAVVRNRWVQAAVAGIAAALVVVLVIAIAVVVLHLSAVVGVVAAIAGVVACIAAAFIYAAKHPVDFSFEQCFFKSLAAGGVAAGLAGSAASLVTAFAAGWAELGLLGTIKSAFWSGVYSMGFDASWNYLFTGQFSWKKALVAFGVGAVSGVVGKLLVKGLQSSQRVLEMIAFGASSVRYDVAGLGRSLIMVIDGFSMEGLLVTVKTVALNLGVRAAYVGFSGTFSLGIHAVTCWLTGTPLTLSGSLAAFLTGSVMGVVALAYRVRGISGMLDKLRFFRIGRGSRLKGVASMLLGKIMRKGVNTGSRRVFRRLFGEEQAE